MWLFQFTPVVSPHFFQTRTPSTLDVVGTSSIESGDPENMGVGVGIVQLRHFIAEIWAFSTSIPFHSTYQTSFPHRSISTLGDVGTGPTEFADTKNMGVSVKIMAICHS